MAGGNRNQIPDVTIGLLTYDLRRDPWRQMGDLVENDRVKLFDKQPLAKLLKLFELEEPYTRASSRFITASYPMFSFGLWEAKKSTGDNNVKAYLQTARKLATLLRWQRRIFDAARCEDFCPLVWFFSSVGSSWEVSGCFERKNPSDEGYTYVSFAFPLKLHR